MRLARWTLLASLVVVAAGPALASIRDESGWPHFAEVRAVLADPADPRGLATLTELGPSAAPTLWALLSGQASVELDLDRTAGRALARAAFAAWPQAATVEQLSRALPPETPFAERLVLLELLSWTETATALPAMFEALAGLDRLQLRSKRIHGALERAVQPILLADDRHFDTLLELLQELPHELLPAVIEAVGALQRTAAVRVLSEIASYGPELESAVLSEIGAQGQRLAPGAAQDCIQLARRHLSSFDPRQRRLAAVALGRLRDVESFFDLVALLEDDDRVVRRVALRSLQELSGLRRSWDAEQWMSWWVEEDAWLAASEGLIRDLAHGDAYRAGAAAQEAARHRLFAENVAALLAYGLENEQPRTRILVCESLARLEHAAAIPVLLDTLRDQDAVVRSSAREALVELTGQDLGEDPRAWDDWWRALG